MFDSGVIPGRDGAQCGSTRDGRREDALWGGVWEGIAAALQDMGNGVTVEELIRTVEDISRSCH